MTGAPLSVQGGGHTDEEKGRTREGEGEGGGAADRCVITQDNSIALEC